MNIFWNLFKIKKYSINFFYSSKFYLFTELSIQFKQQTISLYNKSNPKNNFCVCEAPSLLSEGVKINSQSFPGLPGTEPDCIKKWNINI